MRSFTSRAYMISDLLLWYDQGELELNPAFQRRAVWSPNAKSYLMDTIIRGKPIPKIIIRQKINVRTRKSVREVVDGQQRLRTILEFFSDSFPITRFHNRQFGGLLFSQLPEDVRSQLLTYEISFDQLIDLPDADILDIFGRLNSYAIVLNTQEKLNANHFGPFKLLVDRLGLEYNKYWTSQKLLASREILRMQELSLTADLLIALQEGIKSKKQIPAYYRRYEEKYEKDEEEVSTQFRDTISKIGQIYTDGLGDTEFSRIHVYYSLFTAVAHSLYGLSGLNAPRAELDSAAAISKARFGLDRIGPIFQTKPEEVPNLPRREQQFLTDARRATTDVPVRERRAALLIALMRGT